MKGLRRSIERGDDSATDGIREALDISISEGGNIALVDDASSNKEVAHSPSIVAITGTISAFESVLNANQAASSDAILIAIRGHLKRSNAQATTGVGHHVAMLGHFENDQAGTMPVVISIESKLDNAVGTITSAVLAENQLSSNSGTITLLIGSNNSIAGNASNITSFLGSVFQITSTAGTITNATGFQVNDLSDNSAASTITTIIGLDFKDQASNSTTDKTVIKNRDASAECISDACTTESTSSLTGSIVTAGGMGVGKNLTVGGSLREPSVDTLTGAGAIDLTTSFSWLNNSAVNQSVTIGQGVDGQTKFIALLSGTDNTKLTVNGGALATWTSIDFVVPGETIELKYMSGLWLIMGGIATVI